MLFEQIPLLCASNGKQGVRISERKVVGIEHQNMVERGDVGQDICFELEGESFQLEGRVVPGVGNFSCI